VKILCGWDRDGRTWWGLRLRREVLWEAWKWVDHSPEGKKVFLRWSLDLGVGHRWWFVALLVRAPKLDEPYGKSAVPA
jgi:hypothetical protein